MLAGRIAKRIVFIILMVVIAAVLVRVFLVSDRSALTDIYPTENARSAYSSGESFRTHKISEEIAPDGYYSAAGFIYCPATGELQLTARYNDSAFKYLGAPEGTEFGWRLTDKSSGKSYDGTVCAEDKKYIYNYRKIIFENVEISDDSELCLYLCYNEAYPTDETIGLRVHFPAQSFKDYKPDSAEKQQLSQ